MMKTRMIGAVIAAACLALSWTAQAAPHKAVAAATAPAQASPASPPEAPKIGGLPVDKWLKTLTPMSGRVDLPYAKAALNLGKDYYFLGPEDARKVLVEAWNNPPSAAEDVLGMIFPKRFSPIDEGAWGAVITFEPVGYIKDDDARTADYAAILESSRKDEAEVNERRKAGGFAPVHLVGWAEPPSYDATHHVVIWARDLKFADASIDTLNYDIRVLGRRGVLSLNVVAAVPDIADVHAAAASIEQTAAFNAGERYADFKPGLDKSAGYGIAGLVAAGVGVAAVKKVGLIGVILLFAKKGIALIVAAFAGAGAWLRKLFGGKGGGKGGGAAPPSGGSRLNLGGDPPPSGGGDIVS